MTMTLTPGHAEIYNALPNVEDADQERQSRKDFDDFLDDFAQLVVEAGLADIVGPFLLHRHFLVGGDTAVIERPEVLGDGRLALVSQPRSMSPEAVPVRWEWRRETAQFHPLEYCTDPAAVSSSRELSQNAEFLTAVGHLLENYNLQHLIGLTILTRSLELEDSDSRYSERTFDGMSVITVENSSSRPPGIATAWAAAVIYPDEGVGTKPKTLCYLYCDCAVGCKGSGYGHHYDHQIEH